MLAELLQDVTPLSEVLADPEAMKSLRGGVFVLGLVFLGCAVFDKLIRIGSGIKKSILSRALFCMAVVFFTAVFFIPIPPAAPLAG